MATANDGVSRFADSTVYGATTFVKNITLGSGTTPTAGQLGYIVSGTGVPDTAFTTTISKNVATIALTAGTWLLNATYSPEVDSPAAPSTFAINFSDTTDTFENTYGLVSQFDNSTATGTSESALNCTGFVVIPPPIAPATTTTFYLVATIAFTTGTVSTGPPAGVRFQAIKIA
jgi:hypothetical protein